MVDGASHSSAVTEVESIGFATLAAKCGIGLANPLQRIAMAAIHKTEVCQRWQLRDEIRGIAFQSGAARPRSVGANPGRQTPPTRPLNDEDPAICRAFVEAAEETRTLDLLHGKQTL
jgi:hypothetical protein